VLTWKRMERFGGALRKSLYSTGLQSRRSLQRRSLEFSPISQERLVTISYPSVRFKRKSHDNIKCIIIRSQNIHRNHHLNIIETTNNDNKNYLPDMRVFKCVLLAAALAPSVIAQFVSTNPNPGGQSSCTVDGDCPLINCLIPPCPAAVCVDGFCTVEANPPSPECVNDSDCREHSCFASPCDVNVCNAGVCELVAPSTQDQDQFVTPDGDQSEEEDLSCGPNTCQPGQICCNRSCGYVSA